MDVENVILLRIGEIKQTSKKMNLLNIDIQMPSGIKKRFVIFENINPRFDLLKLFRRNYFKEGQKVSFNYNKADEDWKFDNIWQLKVRDEAEGSSTATTITGGADATSTRS